MSRSARITALLVIDLIFLVVELSVGYAVGSLALVADSFHMLNDVMSLIVALYAIKLSAQTDVDSKYSYGWHRAEILAALINGVFLLALCLSIFMEAMERFFSTPEVSNPKLVVIVGSLGLASNILGLFLFHEHGHSHGHDHGHSDSHPHLPPSMTAPLLIESSASSDSGETTPTHKPAVLPPARSTSPHSHSPSQSFSSMYGHPAATRASLVQTAQEIAENMTPSTSTSRQGRPSMDRLTEEHFHAPQDVSVSATEVGETSPLLEHSPEHDHDHSHSHSKPKAHGSGGHSHASMNMRALVLHVMGDALGNVGVIATGLIIWLSSWSLKYYCDPVISLVITVIIFSSALPLVRSASFILLQAVPPTVSLDAVRESILNVDGVISLHELHVWQLSETKIVASVHVLASEDHDFMPIASKIRKSLHEHGIHSSTIQPEYAGQQVDDSVKVYAENNCLILCPPDRECDPHENACCPPPPAGV